MTNEVQIKNLRCLEWTVQGPGSSMTIVSKAFSFLDQKCHLEFYLDGYNYASNLYLKSERELQSPIHIITRVGTGTAFETIYVQAESITSVNQRIWSCSNRDIRNFLLIVQIIFQTDLNTEEKSIQISSYKDACFSMENISHDFGKLLEEGPNHDVEFVCGDQTVKAHKNILCCRSNVFASMLQSDMVEGKTGRVAIQDIDAAIFHQFLRYLYTGMLPELTVDSAFQLYGVSDKYGVNAMKKQCADFLTDNLTPENACEVLVLSDRHSDADFKQNVMEYVIEEKLPYMGQKWTDFCKENSMLAVEVLNLFCQQFRPK